jgi:N6-adenosine-specific RNA methylase IME4
LASTQNQTPPSNRKYNVLYADPPWSYRTRSAKGKGRNPEAYYSSHSVEQLCALPVGNWAADDAVLLMWITDPLLSRAFEVIAAWGFTYKTVGFCWVKTTGSDSDVKFFTGLGHWTRANPEICLLGTKGRPRRLNRDVRRLVVAPRREHSVKPDDEVMPRIERLLVGPYLALFDSGVNEPRPGWDYRLGKDRAAQRRWGAGSYPGAAEPEDEDEDEDEE